MLTSSALLAPVLPTLLVDEHRRHYTPMLTALAEASKRFVAETPAAVVVLSARWNAPGPFRVDAGRRHDTITDYADLGVEVRHDCPGNPALARAFDEWALASLQRGAWSELSGRDPALAEKAQPEAGLLHLEVLRGFLGDDVQGTLLCYESGPGVGTALMEFVPAPPPAAERAAAGGAT